MSTSAARHSNLILVALITANSENDLQPSHPKGCLDEDFILCHD